MTFLIFDHFMIVDFNFHEFCETGPLAADILTLIDSFNLTQFEKWSPHERGHLLELALSFSLNMND